jgi:flagellar hook-length control protein FliK
MDFAANAVLDAVTPPAREPPTRDVVVAPDDGPSFDDHLDAATRENMASPNAEPTRPAQAPEKSATSDTTNSADSLLGGEVAPLAPAAPQAVAEQTTSPVFVQLIAETTAPAQHAEPQQQAATANAALTPAPSAPAPTAPMQAGANTQDAPTSASVDAATAPASKAAPAKNDASAEKSAAPTAALTQTATSSAQPQTAPTIPAPVLTAPTPQAAESTGVAAAAIAAAAIAPVQTQPDHAARQPKAAPVQGNAKPDAAPAPDRAAATATAPPRASAKIVTPQNTAAKEGAAFAAALDAPEAAPQQQASSAPAAAAASSTHTQQAVAEQSAARAAPATHQVAREIVRKFDGGNTRFELRLDPPELGRVEVRMEVSRDHRVTAVIAADSPQALTELARHARDLEQMLQGAGLELSDSGLSFDLRQGGERAETAEFNGATADGAAPGEDVAPVAARPIGYERWRGVRVDMMV